MTVNWNDTAFETRAIHAGQEPDPATGAVEAVPRHVEIADNLARKICRGLGIPDPN